MIDTKFIDEILDEVIKENIPIFEREVSALLKSVYMAGFKDGVKTVEALNKEQDDVTPFLNEQRGNFREGTN